MSNHSLAREISPRPHRSSVGRPAVWLVAALALVVLAACEHGNLSYDSSTGSFNLPIGAGSREAR